MFPYDLDVLWLAYIKSSYLLNNINNELAVLIFKIELFVLKIRVAAAAVTHNDGHVDLETAMLLAVYPAADAYLATGRRQLADTVHFEVAHLALVLAEATG